MALNPITLVYNGAPVSSTNPLPVSGPGGVGFATLGANAFSGTQTAPTFVASTSIGIGGATIGSNALAVTGTGSFSGAVSPSTNGGAGLGTSSLAWATSYIQQIVSDGNLNLGGNNTTYWRVTGSNGNLTNIASGAQTIGLSTGTGTSDVILSRAAAANWQLGAAAVDTAPVAQTLSVQNVLAGGTSNVAGANFTIAGSQGKGTGVGGSIIFQTAPAGGSGTAVNALTTALIIDTTGLVQFGGTSSSFPALKRSGTGFQVVLADGTAYTSFNAGNASFSGVADIFNATAIPAGGTAGAGYRFSSTSNFGIFFGSGAPTLAAAKGSFYVRSDGSGVADRAYINTNGSTTWTAIATAG